jgi:DNA-binding ferritin-like protein
LNKPHEEFQRQMDAEAKIMDRIEERFKEVGGFTTELSKMIGWEEH